MERAWKIITVKPTAIALVANMIRMKVENVAAANSPVISKASKEDSRNIATETIQVLRMLLKLCMIDASFGFNIPSASLVTAVEPTADPASPTKPTIAG